MKVGEEQNGSRKGWDVERGRMEGTGGGNVYVCYNRTILVHPLTSVVACF